MKTSDAELGSFQFFSLAEDSYASNYSQLTLHQVMRRLMRLLEKQLYKNAEDLEASFDTTLLHPPIDKHDRDTFYPIELMKVNEFRDYYLKKESKNQHKKNYKHQGSLRCIDDLDPLFRLVIISSIVIIYYILTISIIYIYILLIISSISIL